MKHTSRKLRCVLIYALTIMHVITGDNIFVITTTRRSIVTGTSSIRRHSGAGSLKIGVFPPRSGVSPVLASDEVGSDCWTRKEDEEILEG